MVNHRPSIRPGANEVFSAFTLENLIMALYRRLPPLRALQAFEAAARHLSFARAAEELGVTPAAVSQQIKLLEDRLGLPLFRRGLRLALELHAVEAAAALTDAFDRLADCLLRGGFIRAPGSFTDCVVTL